MASYVCSLRRFLRPSSTSLSSIPSIVTRLEHVASSQDSVTGGVGAKGSQGSGPVGPEDKRADNRKGSRPGKVWAPDPDTGVYRPIDEATEAREIALKLNKQ